MCKYKYYHNDKYITYTDTNRNMCANTNRRKAVGTICFSVVSDMSFCYTTIQPCIYPAIHNNMSLCYTHRPTIPASFALLPLSARYIYIRFLWGMFSFWNFIGIHFLRQFHKIIFTLPLLSLSVCVAGRQFVCQASFPPRDTQKATSEPQISILPSENIPPNGNTNFAIFPSEIILANGKTNFACLTVKRVTAAR